MGGRYQTIQVAFKECSLIVVVELVSREEEEVLDFILPVDDESSPVSRLSLEDAEPKSKAVPGVLGVFVAEPNEANAPDPRPNAFEAPAEGDDRPPVRGEMALKGFDRPCELSGPKRFDEWVRDSSGLELTSLSLLVDRDNLLALQRRRQTLGQLF